MGVFRNEVYAIWSTRTFFDTSRQWRAHIFGAQWVAAAAVS
jgi:hypothetical protein